MLEKSTAYLSSHVEPAHILDMQYEVCGNPSCKKSIALEEHDIPIPES